ncbi:MAG: hypothetical protein N2035_09255 [Chthoniobacterales bacterium]|nr:hypothetical protein [Chthoniobacterales bacterium]
MTNSLRIQTCSSPSDLRRFEHAWATIWRNESAFAPPPPGSLRSFLSPNAHFHLTHGSIRPFLALRGQTPVATLAAILNRSHNCYYSDKTGFFGFFSAQNDLEAIHAIFDAAIQFLRSNGCDSLRGPYNPTINDDCGILTDGFQHPPMFGLPWNPPYIPSLLQQIGFQPARTLLSFRFNLNQPLPNRIRRIHTRLVSRQSFSLRSIRMRFLPTELERIVHLYNCTLNRNWGFVPISFSDLHHAAAFLRIAAKPTLIQFIEDRYTPAAFAISLPNFAEVFAKTKKLPRPIQLPATLLLLKLHSFQSARLTVLGVAPQYRDRGLTAWLFSEQYYAALKLNYQSAELAWIEENNHEIIQNSQLMNASLSRKISIFEKKI